MLLFQAVVSFFFFFDTYCALKSEPNYVLIIIIQSSIVIEINSIRWSGMVGGCMKDTPNYPSLENRLISRDITALGKQLNYKNPI